MPKLAQILQQSSDTRQARCVSVFLLFWSFHKTNRFHVAMSLCSNRLQKMSIKCDKNIIDTLAFNPFNTSLFLPNLTSSVIYYWTDIQQHGIYLLSGGCEVCPGCDGFVSCEGQEDWSDFESFFFVSDCELLLTNYQWVTPEYQYQETSHSRPHLRLMPAYRISLGFSR